MNGFNRPSLSDLDNGSGCPVSSFKFLQEGALTLLNRTRKTETNNEMIQNEICHPISDQILSIFLKFLLGIPTRNHEIIQKGKLFIFLRGAAFCFLFEFIIVICRKSCTFHFCGGYKRSYWHLSRENR
jgi:hypothetical protein